MPARAEHQFDEAAEAFQMRNKKAASGEMNVSGGSDTKGMDVCQQMHSSLIADAVVRCLFCCDVTLNEDRQ